MITKFFLALSLLLCIKLGFAKPRLSDYSRNIYSQNGEDGIIQKIFEIIKPRSKIAIEFGAWDGFHLSNTAALWSRDKSWQGILIEGDVQKYPELCRNTAAYNCLAIQAFVGIEKNSCLEAILKKHAIHGPIDLLSIDIDGNDYHIFESLALLRPRIIICEYNPTIPAHLDLYSEYGSHNNFGQSVAALVRLGKSKGYELIALTATNAFFVVQEEFYKFDDYETDVRKLAIHTGHIVLVTTYDGKYMLVNDGSNNYFYGITEPLNPEYVKGNGVIFTAIPQGWPALYTVKAQEKE